MYLISSVVLGDKICIFFILYTDYQTNDSNFDFLHFGIIIVIIINYFNFGAIITLAAILECRDVLQHCSNFLVNIKR